LTVEDAATRLPEGGASCVVLLRDRWQRVGTALTAQLAHWAFERENRLAGLMPLAEPAPPKPVVVSPRRARCDVLLVRGSGCTLAGRDGLRPIAQNELAELVTGSNPPVAMLVEGHGAEHCIQFGNAWLGVDPRLMPPGIMINPSACRIPIVVLLSCAPLRLGDSVTPRHHSIAAALLRAGVTVLGAYHNVFSIQDLERLTFDAIEHGATVGSLANRFNEFIAHRYTMAPFITLGDPRVAFPAIRLRPVSPRGIGSPRKSRASSGLVKLARRLTWLGGLSDTLRKCFPFTPPLQASHDQLIDTARRVLVANRPEAARALDCDDYDLLLELGNSVADTHARNILEALFERVRSGTWVDAIISPISSITVRRANGRSQSAPRFRLTYAPVGNAAPALIRYECSRRGTLRDRIGRSPKKRPVFKRQATGLRVRLPALECLEIGAGLMHRAANLPPFQWPADGGEIRIDDSDLPFRGRVTFAFARLGIDYLCLDYHTYFVDARPSGGEGELGQ
jgi:hypothetical protein